MWGGFFSPSNSRVHEWWLCWRRFHCEIQYEEFFLCGSESSSEWSRHNPHLQSTHKYRIYNFITNQSWKFKQAYSHLISQDYIPFYPFEESWCIHVKFTPPLNPMKRSILTGILTDHITVHKHGDQMTGGKPPLICLKKREQHKNWLKNWEESKTHLLSFMEEKRYSMSVFFFVFFLHEHKVTAGLLNRKRGAGKTLIR